MMSNLRVIATPNVGLCLILFSPLFFQVTYVELGQSSEIEARNGFKIRFKATSGPVLGPPWQHPKNGYLVSSSQGQLTLYYESHCVYNENLLEKERADIVITPVYSSFCLSLLWFLDKKMQSNLQNRMPSTQHNILRFIVPKQNGELDSKGLLVSIVQAEGTMASFK
ncbi:Metallo-hydrolase/oxidoreductase superfamily protein [Euphorbia peplus]|nr:Metallo-hydrolase/oxidoreductase superfamily protein [Euphorbia peplus]